MGSVGPGTKIITLGQITWEQMEQSFFEQIQGLLEGGADVLLIETQQDLLAIKCAIAGGKPRVQASGAARADHGAGVVRSAERAADADRFGCQRAGGGVGAV